MSRNCLYCYNPLEHEGEYHPSCSRKFYGTAEPPVVTYSLDEMAELAKQVVERSISVPGVQPKLSVSVIRDDHIKSGTRLTVVGALGGQYVFKPPNKHFPEIAENEHLTMRMAEAIGIPVVPSSLIRLASGELAYIAKRIDRTEKGEKIHMLDMFQITEAFDKYRSSMEKVSKALHQYSSNTLLDNLYLFELTLFCFLTGNSDMHLKNFSMIDGNSGWTLAPAYDLLNVKILMPDDIEEMALTIDGKKRKLKKKQFDLLAAKLKLTEKQTKGAYNRMFQNRKTAIDWIHKSFLSDSMKEAYKAIMEERYGVLEMRD